MARIRKEKNRYWSKDEKLKMINMVLIDGRTSQDVAREMDISGGLLRGWIIKYSNYGEDSLINKKRPGNPLIKYINRKELSELENLEYENMKLKIEIERLKKGYIVKGDGQTKQFISINKKNMK